MRMIFMEEGRFTMNKKYLVIGALQFFFLVFAFLIFHFDYQFWSKLEKIMDENRSLKEELVSLEQNFLEQIEEDEGKNVCFLYHLNTDGSYIIPSIENLKEEQAKKIEEIQVLESEIKTYEEEKEKWNTEIAELEK